MSYPLNSFTCSTAAVNVMRYIQNTPGMDQRYINSLSFLESMAGGKEDTLLEVEVARLREVADLLAELGAELSGDMRDDCAEVVEGFRSLIRTEESNDSF